MIRKIFSVYDSKVEAYLQPFFMSTKGEAIRAFSELSNDKSTQFGKYPEDHTLFELGTFDDSNCKFLINSTPISLGLSLEFIKPKL